MDLADMLRGLYTQGRNTVLGAFTPPPDTPGVSNDPGAQRLHEGTAGSMVRSAAGWGLPPRVAGAGVEAGGNINEIIAGLLEGLSGRPVVSSRGLDVGDLQANRRGIDSAIAELEQRPASPLTQALGQGKSGAPGGAGGGDLLSMLAQQRGAPGEGGPLTDQDRAILAIGRERGAPGGAPQGGRSLAELLGLYQGADFFPQR